MAELLQQGIARVRGAATAPVAGTAFLISPRHVMTCAHVVNAVLRRPLQSADRPAPDTTLQVDFPFGRRGMALTAWVIEWRPPADGVATDIAVLELDREVPERPYRTLAGLPHRGQAFWTKGFPEGQDGGMDAAGELGTGIEYERLLAHGNALPGFFIEGGFSGTPLLDEVSNAVIGMAAAATRDPSKRTAFIIPADQLELAWPPLARPYKGLNTFREEDRRFFFGREIFVDALAAKLVQMPFVAVVGRSGSGKSSLVRAALLPRLHEEGAWRILVMRPGAPSTDPFRNLAVCLLDAARGTGTGLAAMLDEDAVATLATALRDDPPVLVEHLRRIAGDASTETRLLLVVDQFEELFTLSRDS